MSTPSRRELPRLSTGDAALDGILGGGVPVHSVNVVAGEPGSGKTALVLQMLFHAARQGKSAVYFTTLSESSLKLFRFMQLFEFFDADLASQKIAFVDLSKVLAHGPEATLKEISSRVEQAEPDLVVVDSFRALGDVLGERRGGRAFVYELAVQMTSWGATTLIVGEYTSDEVRSYPEFGVADGVMLLGVQRQELSSVRELEILKMRGTDFVTGRHFFDISQRGLECYPRVRAPDVVDGPDHDGDAREPTGVAGLDQLLGGGVPRCSATLIQGGTGTGKTMLTLQFLVEGARRGQKGLLFALEESPNQLRRIARNLGWNLRELEAAGAIEVIYMSPVELSTDRFLEQARRRIASLGASRVAFDSMGSMELGVSSHRRFRELVYALTKHSAVAGATLFMTLESPELLGSATLSAGGNLSFAADNIIQLRYVEIDGRLDRAISVLKARGIKHGSELRSMSIGAGGVTVGQTAFKDLRGVLTGLPVASAREPK
jgi:circadian clock protein KaiC